MNILVCIKQVPDTQKVNIDPNTGVLMRNGIDSKMNPFDLYAIETAMQINKKVGGTIDVITMGPPAAKEIVLEAFALGCDNGYILSDRKFAGADVLATSYTISQGIKATKQSYDLILCGKQTTDGDTAQVGPAIAEWLKIPHVSWVKKVVEVSSDSITLEEELMDSSAIVKIKYPCLLTVEKGIYEPNLPSYIKRKKSLDKEIKIITFNDMPEKDEKKYGLNGSPTQVEKVFEPSKNDNSIRFNKTTNENVEDFYQVLKDKKMLEVI